MAYQREQQEPVKWVKIGAIWNSDKGGDWCGKGNVDRDIVSWKLKLMLLEDVKIDIFPVKDKQNDRAPDYTICLRVPESLLPDEYWDEVEDRQARSNNRGTDRNGYDRQDRAPAPSARPRQPARPEPQRSQSVGRPAPRSSNPYPPRQESQTRRGRTPEVPDQEDDIVDVFEEENLKEKRRYEQEEDAPASSRSRGRGVRQADDDDF